MKQGVPANSTTVAMVACVAASLFLQLGCTSSPAINPAPQTKANVGQTKAGTADNTKSTPAAKPAKTDGEKPTGNTQTLDNLVASWLKRPEIQHSFVGVEVMELPSGKVLYSSNGNRRFAPASTAKIITCACAYSTLGPGYVYSTKLFAGGSTTADTMLGDLILVPSQDPSISRDNLTQLLATARKAKIKKVNGTLKLAAIAGGTDVFQPNWLIEDFGQEYSPASSNLVVDRNIAEGMPILHGAHNVIQHGNDCPNALERSLLNSEAAAGWLTYIPSSHEVIGYIGNGVTEKSPLPVSDPDEYNTAMGLDILQNQGITIGRSEGGGTPQTLLGEHLSQPLPIILRHTLHKSDNLYSQQLVRTLGLPAPSKDGKPPKQFSGALEDIGIARIGRWLNSIGVPSQEAVMFDGCGLSRKNGISPHALNMVLKFMAGPKVDGPFLGLLKESGTATRKGEFFFKTGSMDTVRSITGVLGTAGGQQLAVAIIINDHTQNIKNLGGTLTELVSLLNEITSISFVMTNPNQPSEEKVVIQTTKPSPGGVSYGRGRKSPRRRRH
ncbi:MAG TPA: D-alanyl-D-alanine carboxypeptidase [Trichormus sp.]|jgi:D-alanyl-D-alanine carboxypeptidase/D-alanyl-D-alanine-endopeptidase (penicillin-binding protein 4)